MYFKEPFDKEKIEKQHEEQMQRIKKKLSNFDLLHEDLKK